MQDSFCMDALLCPDFDQARDLRGDRHARRVLLGQKRGVRLHRDFAANVALRWVGHGSGGGLFAVSSGRDEVVREQHDSARLRQRNKALKCPSAGEAGVLVVCADKVPAGLVCNGLRDLRGCHPGFSESSDGFHAADRNTLKR